ncbi:uncharacterized protein Aud_001439 [Aspergillus udagawae]|uniref:Uncharacterized protein n=1 Tax=Aspergillus udagawae TaxID=91492 RepID=A0A8E0QML5_9EURO|nr:uncharacterized protein Aud_001439 [Aspergillus udagawae]GIC85606.1 hypothetical protein Aud_001439 [Aspergillus udagawae]
MRVSVQIIAGLALAAGTANAGLYRRAHQTSTSSEITTTPTETATMTTPVIDKDPSATETSASGATESDVSTVFSSADAHPTETTSIPLIKPTDAASSEAASSSAAGISTAPLPKATGTGDYVGVVDPTEESSSSGGHSSGSGSGSKSGSSSSGGSSSSSNDNGEENTKPTTSRHTSPGSTLVVPGLAALGSLAIGLMVLV